MDTHEIQKVVSCFPTAQLFSVTHYLPTVFTSRHQYEARLSGDDDDVAVIVRLLAHMAEHYGVDIEVVPVGVAPVGKGSEPAHLDLHHVLTMALIEYRGVDMVRFTFASKDEIAFTVVVDLTRGEDSPDSHEQNSIEQIARDLCERYHQLAVSLQFIGHKVQIGPHK